MSVPAEYAGSYAWMILGGLDSADGPAVVALYWAQTNGRGESSGRCLLTPEEARRLAERLLAEAATAEGIATLLRDAASLTVVTAPEGESP